MSATDQGLSSGTDPGNDWKQVQESPEFAQLRHRLRTFVFPMTVLFLAWYLVYVLLADYAPKFMATKIAGNFNVGLLIGLLQFVSTFVITGLYVRYANRKLDPIADRIRGDIEGEQPAEPQTESGETKAEETKAEDAKAPEDVKASEEPEKTEEAGAEESEAKESDTDAKAGGDAE